MKSSDKDGILGLVLSHPEILGQPTIREQLLHECFSSTDPLPLSHLLQHHDQRVVQNVLLVVSELGGRAQPLRQELLALLAHPGAPIRWFALATLHGMLEFLTVSEVARILEAIAIETDQSVRERGFDLIASFRSQERRRSALAFPVNTAEPPSLYTEMAKELVAFGSIPTRPGVELIEEASAQRLRVKIKHLFDYIDGESTDPQSAEPTYEDVRNVAKRIRNLKARRSQVRDYITALREARQGGDTARVEALSRELRDYLHLSARARRPR
jgi:hypothetical protein